MPWEEHGGGLLGGVPRGWGSEKVALLCSWGQAGLQRLLPGTEGWIATRGTGKGRLGGDVTGCCRREPVPLLPRDRERSRVARVLAQGPTASGGLPSSAPPLQASSVCPLGVTDTHISQSFVFPLGYV